ncbi:MAG: PAS domain S-box protein [Candidatus Scalindua sp.]|nr:PAS domain S-box protein [Candidatus Scalindua sp.]
MKLSIEQELREKNSFLQILHAVAVTANKAEGIKDAFEPVLKVICQHTAWPIGHAYIVSKNNPDLLAPTTIWYLEDAVRFADFCKATETTTFTRGIGLPGRVFSDSKPHWIIDVTKDSGCLRASFASAVGIKAGFAFPVVVGAEVGAVLEFYGEEAVEPDYLLLEIMADVGIQLGQVIERKRTEEELKFLNISLEKRVAERTTELKESEEKFRKICSSAQDAIIMLESTGMVSYWNKAAEIMFEYSNKDVVGKYLQDPIIPEWFKKGHINDFKRFQGTEKGASLGRTIELTALRKSGELFPIELSLSSVKLNGKWNTIGMVRDITERKKMEENLLREILWRKDVQEKQKEAVNELKRSNEELQQFAYVASHDLQEPLRMVSSYTQLLARRYKDELDSDAHEFINFAVDGANRMKNLIDDLLEYSRVGSSGKTFIITDLPVVIDKAKNNLQMAIKDSGAVITCDNLPSIMANSTQLVQLFQNLIGNAIKFRGELTPQVHVSAEQQESEWLLSVSDNGIGIEQQYADRIFAIFQRLHKKTEYPGSGIGLAISKKIVELHGGTIWMKSEPGNGTTINLTIPIIEEAKQ